MGMIFHIRSFSDDEWPEWSPPRHAPLIAYAVALLPIVAWLAFVVWLVKRAL